MRKLGSSSSSDELSCWFQCCFLQIMYFSIGLVWSLANADRFDPLIQLPTSGLLRNNSETLVLNVDEFGAKGDGVADDTKTLQDIWAVACTSLLPAKIVIPSGKAYLIKPTDFAGPCNSKVTLRVSGAVVAPNDPDVWDGLNLHKWLYFHGVEHLTVEGSGAINGMGEEWWARSCKTNESNPCTQAPTAITFHRCNNLKIRKLTLVNSQKMHIAFTSCEHVAASGLKVIAPADSPNTDGVHISASTYVELKDAIIATGDDCISIVSNSSRVRIKNIICGPGHGISIGSLGEYNRSDMVQDIVVNGATLFNTQNGVRIKSWQGGSGFARKITFQNIRMIDVSNPIIIDQFYCDSSVPCLNQTSAVRINNISFRGIKGTSATEEAVVLLCSDSHPCKKLHFEDIQLISSSGITKSVCWEAYGTVAGVMYPPSCIISPCGSIIKHDDEFNPKGLQEDNYASI